MDVSNISDWRVLIVDDEPDSIEVVELVLLASGVTVYKAEDGVEAMEVVKLKQPNLVLTDLSMPEMDGWQLLKNIQSTPTGAKIIVLALTAHAMHGDKERVMKAGFDGYMAKPLRMMSFLDDLIRCLEEAGTESVRKDSPSTQEEPLAASEESPAARRGFLDTRER